MCTEPVLDLHPGQDVSSSDMLFLVVSASLHGHKGGSLVAKCIIYHISKGHEHSETLSCDFPSMGPNASTVSKRLTSGKCLASMTAAKPV